MESRDVNSSKCQKTRLDSSTGRYKHYHQLTPNFRRGNGAITRKLLRDLQGSQSVSIYYTKMKSLWDELASYHDLISCNCGGLKGLADREKKQRVMQFLMGLNESFATV
ncbi:hypothetical protein ACOSQ4_006925 [Xanthoceras sorbifolium]